MSDKQSTILIVDDDKVVIEQLVTHFRRRNYEPIATANPTIVNQTLEAYRVDLILLDLRMERLNGYEVLKKLRDNKINIPVLIITAYYHDEKEKLKSVGITQEDVIEKPFRDFSKIEVAINRKLNRVISPQGFQSDYEDEIYYDNKTKVVLVDDEIELNDLLKEVLEARRYHLTIFTDGKKAYEYMQNNECHVAIIDMKIPGMDGQNLIKELMVKKPNLKIIPISASYAKEMKALLQGVGFPPDKLVEKPFDIPTMVEQIKVYATELGVLGSSN